MNGKCNKDSDISKGLPRYRMRVTNTEVTAKAWYTSKW